MESSWWFAALGTPPDRRSAVVRARMGAGSWFDPVFVEFSASRSPLLFQRSSGREPPWGADSGGCASKQASSPATFRRPSGRKPTFSATEEGTVSGK
ncbi:MAG: hypothetical protein HY774_00730 [Acidobacteria bacterium]|nr:hypothetical protein [Acidobacteriota bacterium]